MTERTHVHLNAADPFSSVLAPDSIAWTVESGASSDRLARMGPGAR